MKSANSSSKKNIPDWLLKAREKWEYDGSKRPPFAESPKKGQLSVWDFPRPPALDRIAQTLQVYHQGIPIATSKNGFAILETASPPTYYIPPQDVNHSALVAIANKQSLCEWKGQAQYWALMEDPLRPVAWSYAKPFEPYEDLKDCYAFYPQYLNCFVDGEKVIPQPGQFYAGWITKNLTGPFKGEPGTEHW